jgi:secreted trypsin-like serine protease
LRRAPPDRPARYSPAGLSLQRVQSALLVAPVALLIMLGLAAAAPSRASASRPQPRVVAGHATPIADAPFQVALYDPEGLDPEEPDDVRPAQFCGGVVRDATHIITAAHCVTFGGFEAALPSQIEVLAGTDDLEATTGPGVVEDPVVTTSFDPAYDPFTNDHDVGVLTLEKPLWSGTRAIDGTSTIAPIELAEAAPSAGDAETVSGWGFTKALTPEQEATPQEESEGYPAELQSAAVSIVDRSQCSADYEPEGFEPFGDDLICAIGEATPTADACFGDSGGPLFSGEPGSAADRLLGLVGFGLGCAQRQFPGVYQSLAEPSNRAFAGSNPSQAPRSEGVPRITGVLQIGQTVACDPGAWLGAPQLFYRFYRDESTLLRPAFKALTAGLSANASYTLKASDAATRIFCQVVALNDGGRGEAIGEDASVAAVEPPPATPPVPTVPTTVKPAPAPLPPTLRLISARCRRGGCAVSVRVSKGIGATLVAKVEAKLSFTRKLACRKHGRRATCKRTTTRTLAATKLPGERFSIVATGLRPGAYTMTLVAIDAGGLRQAHATKLALLLRAPRGAR